MNIENTDAYKAAKRSSIKRFKTGAAIYARDGTLLAIGWSHVPNMRLTETPYSIHAEHHALRNLAPGAKPYRIEIVTISKKGNITCGNPCWACAKKLRRHKIKEIIASQRAEEK